MEHRSPYCRSVEQDSSDQESEGAALGGSTQSGDADKLRKTPAARGQKARKGKAKAKGGKETGKTGLS